jgi:Flp pilus assembly protein TadG
MKRTPLLRRMACDCRGVTAVEFAFCLPVLMVLIMGSLWAGLLTFSVSSMDSAVQIAARCMAIDVNNCASTSATETYAKNNFHGPNISPVFTASASGCGHTVTGEATFDLAILPGMKPTPISATACYP